MTATLAFLSLYACAPAEQVNKLEERLAALEEKVTALESKKPAAGGADGAAFDPAQEEAARGLLAQLQEEMGKGQFDAAKANLDKLMKEYGATQTARRAASLKAELDVIGKPVPAAWDMEKWFQGEKDVNLTSTAPTLIVFWEVWCPHCKREVPKLQETYAKFKPKGLQMVGLTKVSKSATDESVAEFIKTESVSYPIAKEKGDLSEHFAVRGIPAAAAIKDGKVIWRGHPARLTDDIINGWL